MSEQASNAEHARAAPLSTSETMIRLRSEHARVSEHARASEHTTPLPSSVSGVNVTAGTTFLLLLASALALFASSPCQESHAPWHSQTLRHEDGRFPNHSGITGLTLT